MHVLVLNAGSSTLKYALFELGEAGERALTSATIKGGGSSSGALERVLTALDEQGQPTPQALAHRIVHGGRSFTGPVLVDDGVLSELERLIPLAPLHLPPALELLRAAQAHFPHAPHVACFDTAFHAELPLVAARLPMPLELERQGLRRYGFHGLSYEYALSTLGVPAPRRVIIAHLGSGVSLAAIADGHCIDTSMGLTPSGGVPMGTRSGDLDPGLLLYLQREGGYSLDQLEHLINHESGLKGLCGSADMAELLERCKAGDTAARSALQQFCYAIKKQLGAYFAALGGLDVLAFTGGIGEHAPLVRELVCAGLEPLGIELDRGQNERNAASIGAASAPSRVLVVRANEELVMARAARRLTGG